MTKCVRAECANEASKQLRITLLAKGSDVPAVGKMGMMVCDEHATQSMADEVLAQPVARQQIEMGLSNGGFAKPDWSRCKADWVPITRL